MKYLNLIIIYSTMLLAVFACSNQSDDPIEPALQEYRFTYNGKEYYKGTTDYNPELVVSSFQGKVSILIDMIPLFGGVVYLDRNDCGFLEPEFTKVYHDDDCNLSSLVNGHIVPIDSVKVFTYESGSLHVEVSDCKSISVCSVGCWNFLACKASGTFEVTLVNKNNERIEIKNGVIKNMDVYSY